ncbi:ser/Thr protein phosphatase family protein [Plectosphaerella cucumerina]|uniref:Ser/Thr protein phosphatase family protein n=1 Tax=Plectosphaerella cucumerina TaxID=40658 RepID=A0A8K0TM01_9PEZI|nr:ser/Thr protein phosphatase family protein [Plectosphaerella cucumerina]
MSNQISDPKPHKARDTSPEPRKPVLRRTRFVLVSDTHNATPHLPRGDVLIHAGDITNRGTQKELSRSIQWLEKADFEAKIVIAGNHDVTLDADFYARQGHALHAQQSQDPQACKALLTSSSSLIYLEHSSQQIKLTSPQGPRTTFTIFGSPFSPRDPAHDPSFGAFTYPAPPLHDLSPSTTRSPSDLPSLWDAIPLDADVVVTHTPARTHLDEAPSRRAKGCEALRRALWRVRPRLAVCGHVHEARGVERVTWDLDCGNVAFKEAGITPWDDPGVEGRKMSVVGLGGRNGSPLQNDGSRGLDHVEKQETGDALRIPPAGIDEAGPPITPGTHPTIGTLGLGGRDPSSMRCDTVALLGRTGRRETCFVNCAIMATSYPQTGGRVMNKPIVVDIDLPAWDE